MQIILSLAMIFSCYINIPDAHAETGTNTLQSDWLTADIGSTGELIGAEIINVKNEPNTDHTVIDIALPIDNLEEIDTIEVISKKNNQAIKQTKQFKWLQDYEKGIYGIRLHLQATPNLEFRLHLDDQNRISDAD